MLRLDLSHAANVASSRIAASARMAEFPPDSIATMLGWGETFFGDPSSLSQTLKIVTFPVEHFNNQVRSYAEGDPAASFYDWPRDTRGTAGGDTGGPALFFRDSEWFVFGVAHSTSTGFSTEWLVPSYFDWIVSTTAMTNVSYLPSAQIMAVVPS